MLTPKHFLLIIPLFFIQINSLEFCRNGRVCPENYKCSPGYENFCCQNGTCDVPSKYSYLKSQCTYYEEVNKTCPDNEYCTKHNQCISKKVSICEDYIPLIESTKCAETHLSEGFLLCAHIYSTPFYFRERDSDEYKKYVIKLDAVQKCGEQCFRHNISNYLLNQSESYANFSNNLLNQNHANFSNENSCYVVEKFAFDKVVECYLDCGVCFEPKVAPRVFYRMIYADNDTVKKEMLEYIAMRCYGEYLDALKFGEKWSEIKEIAKELINGVTHYSYHIFEDLLGIEGGEGDSITVNPINFNNSTDTSSTVNLAEICYNNRACPENYTCSIGSRDFCCRDDKCDVRNTWSFLKSECPYNTKLECPDDFYCVNDEKCVTKEISICDNYLPVINSTNNKCDSSNLIENFDLCGKIFSTHNNFSEEENNPIHKCGEICFKQNISSHILNHADFLSQNDSKNQYDSLKDFAEQKYIECYIECGTCFNSALLYNIFKHGFCSQFEYKEWTLMKKFSMECIGKYLNEIKNGEKVGKVKRIAEGFIKNMHIATHYNVSSLFEDLMEIEGEKNSTP